MLDGFATVSLGSGSALAAELETTAVLPGDRSDVVEVAEVGWAVSVDPQAEPVSAIATRAKRSAGIRPRWLRESGTSGVVFASTGEPYGPECDDVKPNQSSARDGSSDDGNQSEPPVSGPVNGEQTSQHDFLPPISPFPGGTDHGDQRDGVPLPPVPLPPSNAGSSQTSVRGGSVPPVPPPPTAAPPTVGNPAMPPAAPLGAVAPEPPLAHSNRSGWRAALVAINLAAIIITAIAVTLLLTTNDDTRVDISQPLSETTTTARPAATSPATSPAATSSPVTTVVQASPVPDAAPTPSSPSRAQITTTPTSPPATEPPPTEPPPPALPSEEDARYTAQSTIEAFLAADSSNQVDEALGYLMEPLDTWVDATDQSLSQVREDIDGSKSDNTQLTMLGDVTLTSGPQTSDLGDWEVSVTYELQATGSYYSDKYQEDRCIDNVQQIEDRIVVTSDGEAKIKGHRRVMEVSNNCSS